MEVRNSVFWVARGQWYLSGVSTCLILPKISLSHGKLQLKWGNFTIFHLHLQCNKWLECMFACTLRPHKCIWNSTNWTNAKVLSTLSYSLNLPHQPLPGFYSQNVSIASKHIPSQLSCPQPQNHGHLRHLSIHTFPPGFALVDTLCLQHTLQRQDSGNIEIQRLARVPKPNHSLMYLNTRRFFNKATHNLLINKSENCGLDKITRRCLGNWVNSHKQRKGNWSPTLHSLFFPRCITLLTHGESTVHQNLQILLKSTATLPILHLGFSLFFL